MTHQEKFLLKWDDHHTSFFTTAEDLCRSELLCDVTLACGGQVFQTHKLILCICSPYFRSLLTTRPDQHPIVYLKDVNPKHLEQLLSYMYKGEISIPQDDLDPLIETARGLQITLFADACTNNKSIFTNSNENQIGLTDKRNLNQTSTTKQLLTPPSTPSETIRISENNASDKSFSIITVEPPNDIIKKEEEEDCNIGIIEVNSSDKDIKQEIWTDNAIEEEDEKYDIFTEQLQVDDETYTNEGIEGKEKQSPSMLSPKHLYIPRGQYNLQDMATAFNQVLESGETVAKMARKYNVPRKTLENYVSGRTNIVNLYKKLGKHFSPLSGRPYNRMQLGDMYATTDRLPYSDLPAHSNYL